MLQRMGADLPSFYHKEKRVTLVCDLVYACNYLPHPTLRTARLIELSQAWNLVKKNKTWEK